MCCHAVYAVTTSVVECVIAGCIPLATDIWTCKLLNLLSLQALSQALTSWREAAAAAGSLPVLASLSQAEVSGLSAAQAEAVTRHVLGLEAQGRLLMRQAAAGQLVLAQLSASDADALAWKVHTGGTAAAEELVQLLLQQVSQHTNTAILMCIVLHHEDVHFQDGGWLLGLLQPLEQASACSQQSCVLCRCHQAQPQSSSGGLTSLAQSDQD